MKLQYISDIFGNPYIGIELELYTKDSNGVSVHDMLVEAYSRVPDFRQMNDKLLKRNGGKYHITAFGVSECRTRTIVLEGIESTIGANINDIKFNGIGVISNSALMNAYFITVESEQLNDIRRFYGLNDKELHVTIGFNIKDLFHESKNISNVYALQ
jgi:hypothetical protein